MDGPKTEWFGPMDAFKWNGEEDRDRLNDAVCELLYQFGPDGHVDGNEQITDFIVEMLKLQREESTEITR